MKGTREEQGAGTRNVEVVLQKGRCTGCGTCEAVCPSSCLRMEVDQRKRVYVPRIDQRSCIECGVCLESCGAYAAVPGRPGAPVLDGGWVPFLLGKSYPAMLSVLSYRLYIDVDLNARPQAMAMSILIAFFVLILVVFYRRISQRILRSSP